MYDKLWEQPCDAFPLVKQQLDNLSKNLESVLALMLEGYEEYIVKSDQKGILSFINISFLRSGALLQTPFYRVDFYDEKHYFDISEYYAMWDIAGLSNTIYTVLPCNEQLLRELKVPLWEREQQWMENALYLHHAIKHHALNIILDINKCLLKRLRGIEIYIGEYLDQSTRIEFDQYVE